jgi:hypothetical protein
MFVKPMLHGRQLYICDFLIFIVHTYVHISKNPMKYQADELLLLLKGRRIELFYSKSNYVI